VLLKATKVNGVYSRRSAAQPWRGALPVLTFDRVLTEKLNVMDATRHRHVPRQPLAFAGVQSQQSRDLTRIVRGRGCGTAVTFE